MATVICSKCGYVHQVERDIPIGKSVRCAKCKETFVVSEHITQPLAAETLPATPVMEVKRIKPMRSAWWDVVEDLTVIAVRVIVLGGAGVAVLMLMTAPDRSIESDPLIRIENLMKGIHFLMCCYAGVWVIANAHTWLMLMDRDTKR